MFLNMGKKNQKTPKKQNPHPSSSVIFLLYVVRHWVRSHKANNWNKAMHRSPPQLKAGYKATVIPPARIACVQALPGMNGSFGVPSWFPVNHFGGAIPAWWPLRPQLLHVHSETSSHAHSMACGQIAGRRIQKPLRLQKLQNQKLNQLILKEKEKGDWGGH